MLRISKLTDYGTVMMVYLASKSQDVTHTAKEVATQTSISLPTVSKLLKLLARAGLLQAQRGTKGGYHLALSAEKISLAQIIDAMEGSMGLTECSHQNGSCSREGSCATRGNWRTISTLIHKALKTISLAEMANPLAPEKVQKSIALHLPKTLSREKEIL